MRNKRPEVQCHPQHNLGSKFWRLQIIKKVDLWRPFQIYLKSPTHLHMVGNVIVKFE